MKMAGQVKLAYWGSQIAGRGLCGLCGASAVNDDDLAHLVPVKADTREVDWSARTLAPVCEQCFLTNSPQGGWMEVSPEFLAYVAELVLAGQEVVRAANVPSSEGTLKGLSRAMPRLESALEPLAGTEAPHNTGEAAQN